MIFYSCKKESNKLEEHILACNYLLRYNIQIMMDLLVEENYVANDKITKKGVIATGINECNELLFTEMIFEGWLEDLDFPEIIAVLSSFINEKDPNSRDKYISDLKVPRKVENVLHKLVAKAEYFMKSGACERLQRLHFRDKPSRNPLNLEDKHKININNDYSVYLDFIEPAFIWAKWRHY